MAHSDLTLTKVMHDPLIRQVLRADGISLPKFAAFLQDAARKHQKSTADACFDAMMPTALPSRRTNEPCTKIANAGLSRQLDEPSTTG